MPKKAPKVLKVKDEEPNDKFDDIHDILPTNAIIMLDNRECEKW